MRFDLAEDQGLFKKSDQVSRFDIKFILRNAGLHLSFIEKGKGSVSKVGLLQIFIDEYVKLVGLDSDRHGFNYCILQLLVYKDSWVRASAANTSMKMQSRTNSKKINK